MSKNEELEVIKVGLVNCLVCTNVKSKKRIEELTDRKVMTGLNHGWKITKSTTFPNGQPHPISCEDKPKTHKHYLLEC